MGDIINSVQPQKHKLSLTSCGNSRNKWLIIIFWIAGIAMGAWQAWEARNHMSADGMSYIDVADTYLRGDWKMAVNGFLGPLYSWLLGLGMFLLKPSPYYEFTVVHIVNFLIYLFTIGCFHFFILQLINYHRSGEVLQNRGVTFPEWAWIALGYCLFLETSLVLIGVWEESPDMLVAALVYLACGIILRIRNGMTHYVTYAFLGVVLGLGYLSKAVMFPLAFIFLSLSAFSMGNIRKALPRTMLALIIFLTVASPFITALSISKGRITFGDSGKINYWFHVNGHINYHWDGDPPGSGMPKHPPRRILDMPVIYEFGTPIGGTYPLWYDASYWFDGLETHFDLKKQLQAIKNNVKTYYPMFYPKYSVLFFSSLILYVMSRRRWSVITDIAEQYILFIPVVTALSMYALVSVSGRYVGPFITLMWLGIFSGVRLPDSEDSRRLLKYVTVVMVLVLMMVGTNHFITRHLIIKKDAPFFRAQWQVADTLNKMGIGPGDKVASIGNSHAHFWARLARVKIVAEMPHQSVVNFWNGDDLIKSKVFEAFAKTGAKAVVTNLVPDNTSPYGWQHLADSNYYVYMLNK
jgi:hypothetical protein